MADLVRLAQYPFLPGVKQAMAQAAPSVADLLTGSMYDGIRRRATERVHRIFTDEILETPNTFRDMDAMDDLLVHAVTRMLLVCLGDRHAATRFASKESARVFRLLKTESEEGLQEIVDELDIPLDMQPDLWRMHFTDYLAAAPAKTEWKLVLRTVEAGWVPLVRLDVHGLCQEALRRRIESDLHEELKTPAPKDLLAALGPYIDELGPQLAEARKHWNTGDFGTVQDRAFPPCITDIFEQMSAGVILSHPARFAFASFLGTIGMTGDDILDYMSQLPNFSRDKSEYQIRHISGELSVDKYTPPGCAWMQSNGVCPLAKRDDICFNIKHPLSYYRRAKKRLPEPIKDESKAAESGRGPASAEAAAPGAEAA